MNALATEFTPAASLAGGVLIGAAAVLLMWTHGRIAGATGILTGFFVPKDREDWLWRAAVLAGMATAPAMYLIATGAWPEIHVPAQPAMLIVGGLLVGAGVSLAGGCTSGHGVCGIARLSVRSIVATLAFMAATFTTVFVIRHLIGA
ncbi:MAG: YeeE/YedE family protein [Pseudomonadota bacterium]